MTYERARYVLKDHVRREHVDEVALREAWLLQKEVPSRGLTPFQKHWATPDMRTGIVYCEEASISVRFIELRALDLEKASAHLASLVDLYRPDELETLAVDAETADACMDAIRKASIAAPKEIHPTFFEIFLRGMRHPDARVRVAAIEAAPYVKWRQLEEPLAELSHDGQVGRHARIILDAMRTVEWKKTA